jgi:zinc transporter
VDTAIAAAPLDCDTYGSDNAGLVCAYRFSVGRPGRPIVSDEAAAWLAGGGEDDGDFVWLHFNLANSAATRWLRQYVSLPAFHESLKDSSSTRVERTGDWLLATINDVQFFTADASAASTVSLCVEPRMLVSARTTPLRSLDRLRASVRAGETFRSPAGLLAHLLHDQADVLAQIVRDATLQVDAIEDKLIAGQAAMPSRPKLASLRRVLVRLQRLLAPEPAALFRLLGRAPAWIGADELHALREAAEELAQSVARSVALVERVRLLQEELFALVNEQINRTLFVLTVVTVTALPLTIIPGLFGMNVGGVPLRDHEGGFWIMVGLLATLTSLGAIWAFRRRSDL